jgi:hypothetical protein
MAEFHEREYRKHGHGIELSGQSERIHVRTLPLDGCFEPKRDADFDLMCICGHSYDNHVWSETPEGSDCEYVTCRCTQFRLASAAPDMEVVK